MGLWGFQNPDRRVLATWSLSPMGQETPLCRALGAEQPGAQGPGGQPGALGRRVAWGGLGREPVGGGVCQGTRAGKEHRFSRPQRSSWPFCPVLPRAVGQGADAEGGPASLPPSQAGSPGAASGGEPSSIQGAGGRGREGLCGVGWLREPVSQGLSAALLEGLAVACVSSCPAARLLQGGPSASGSVCVRPGEDEMSLGRVVSLAAGARVCGGRTRATRASTFPSGVSPCPGLGGLHPCDWRTEGRPGAWART